MNAEGKTTIVKAVKEAERQLLANETTKNYLTIDGVQAYKRLHAKIAFR